MLGNALLLALRELLGRAQQHPADADLQSAKLAIKGMAEIRVGTAAHQIDVKVTADKESYAVRGKAQKHKKPVGDFCRARLGASQRP